jgi:hypothetical protein
MAGVSRRRTEKLIGRSARGYVFIALTGGLCGVAALSQSKSGLPDPVTFTAEQDHRNMMDQLGIEKLRSGPQSCDACLFVWPSSRLSSRWPCP